MTEKEKISKKELEHLSKLALIDFSEDEKESLMKDLTKILNYFQKLSDLNTENVTPLVHPIEGLKNIFREDIPKGSLSREEVLKNAKYTKDGFFKAPKIIKQ